MVRLSPDPLKLEPHVGIFGLRVALTKGSKSYSFAGSAKN
jgi:hypothetical protein